MKLIICFIILLPTLVQASPSELFHSRRKAVLENREISLVKKLSQKLEISEEMAYRDLRFKRNKDIIIVSGYINGKYGICKASGKLMLQASQTNFVCISAKSKVTYFFL